MKENNSYVRVSAKILLNIEEIKTMPLNWGRTSTVHLSKTNVEISPHADSFSTEELFFMLYAAIGELKEEIVKIKEKLEIPSSEKMKEKKVEISGSRIIIYEPTPRDYDKIYKLTFVLPLNLPLKLQVVAKLDERPHKEPKTDLYVNNFKFKLISDDDRELIIRYTFKRQRELINIGKL